MGIPHINRTYKYADMPNRVKVGVLVKKGTWPIASDVISEDWKPKEILTLAINNNTVRTCSLVAKFFK